MIKHLFAAALIVSASVGANAQSDQPQPSQQPSNQLNSRDYTQIQSSDVPQSLRTTLQGDTYKGWESGKLYRRNNGDGYYLTTGSGTNIQTHYFDKRGKAIQRGTTGTDKLNSGAGQGTASDGGVRSGSDAGSGNESEAGSSGSSGSPASDKPKQ